MVNFWFDLYFRDDLFFFYCFLIGSLNILYVFYNLLIDIVLIDVVKYIEELGFLKRGYLEWEV